VPQVEQGQLVVQELRDVIPRHQVPQRQAGQPLAACLREQQGVPQGAVPPALQVEVVLPQGQKKAQQRVSSPQELWAWRLELLGPLALLQAPAQQAL